MAIFGGVRTAKSKVMRDRRQKLLQAQERLEHEADNARAEREPKRRRRRGKSKD